METKLAVLSTSELIELIKSAVNEAFEKIKPLQSPIVEDDFIEIDEVCKLLKVSRSSIFVYRKKGYLPFHRLGRHVRYKKSEVINSLKKIHQK
jgi:excisionase family DNA binding protein